MSAMHSMETKIKKHYWEPASQVFSLQPVRILNNSLTDYNTGNLDESGLPFDLQTMPSFWDIPSPF